MQCTSSQKEDQSGHCRRSRGAPYHQHIDRGRRPAADHLADRRRMALGGRQIDPAAVEGTGLAVAVTVAVAAVIEG